MKVANPSEMNTRKYFAVSFGKRRLRQIFNPTLLRQSLKRDIDTRSGQRELFVDAGSLDFTLAHRSPRELPAVCADARQFFHQIRRPDPASRIAVRRRIAICRASVRKES